MPYNYLVDVSVRGNLQIPWKNSVVIVDEAHNLESVCEDAASFTLKSIEISQCVEEVDTLLFKASTEEASESFSSSEKDLLLLKKLLLDLERVLSEIELKSLNFGTGKGIFKPGGYILELFSSIGVNNEHKANDYLQILKTCVDDNEMKKLENFLKAFQRVFIEDMSMLALARRADQYFSVYVTGDVEEQKQNNQRKNGLFVFNFTKQTAQPTERVLNFWCFSPGVTLSEMKSLGVSSVLLTSGTLNPLDSFSEQFFTTFPHRVENAHVIKGKQCFLAVCRKGPYMSKLNSSYKMRSTTEYKTELGNSLLHLSRKCPNGMLIFFPSYAAMNTCFEFWENDSSMLLTQIKHNKDTYTEPKSSKDVPDIIERFTQSAATSRGAILFCVCRGKISEGIDFADFRCRTVVVTGLPFPPSKDAKITLKKAFLNRKRSKLTGQKWYVQQASRAVNQAIGRVIRHKLDFGAIILLDERFASNQQKEGLSKWLRPRRRIYEDFLKMEEELKQFFNLCLGNETLKKTYSLPVEQTFTNLNEKSSINFNGKDDALNNTATKSYKKVLQHLTLSYGDEESFKPKKEIVNLIDFAQHSSTSESKPIIVEQNNGDSSNIISLLGLDEQTKSKSVVLSQTGSFMARKKLRLEKEKPKEQSKESLTAVAFLNKCKRRLAFSEYDKLKTTIQDLTKNKRLPEQPETTRGFRKINRILRYDENQELKLDLYKFLPDLLKPLYKSIVLK